MSTQKGYNLRLKQTPFTLGIQMKNHTVVTRFDAYCQEDMSEFVFHLCGNHSSFHPYQMLGD